MKISRNTVLITGGATGIGFSLAQEFAGADSEVIICGRREENLNDAKSKLPGIHTRVCDVSNPKDRRSLHDWVTTNFREVNILVNNAGVQRMLDFKNGIQELEKNENEIEINLTSAIHLSALFITSFLQRKEAAIINISSGLAFVPIASMPIYCATKAALHSFTISLRHQLGSTPIRVFEIVPPTVDTDLDKGSRAQRNMSYRGISPSEVASSAMRAFAEDEFERAVGQALNLVAASNSDFQAQFARMNH